MRYNYLKYSVRDFVRFSEGQWIIGGADYYARDSGHDVIEIYNGYVFDSTSQVYKGLGTPLSIARWHIDVDSDYIFEVVDDSISINGYSYRVKKVIRYTTVGQHNGTGDLLRQSYTIEKLKDVYIDTVIAEDGIYPNNGLHDDGYWYVKSTEINEPPTKPTIIAPNGGEVITAPFLIKWEPSSDINNNPIRYQVELSTNNGKNWNHIASGITGTQFTFDFAGQPDTSTAKIRVRGFDGALFGEWAISEDVFTINYNYPPNPPYNLLPNNNEIVDNEKTLRFTWNHSDPNSSDPQSKFELRWRKTGESIWNTINEITTRTYQDVPSGTLPLGKIEWQVRTYDQAGLVSEWSNFGVFTSGSSPETAIWTYPTNGLTVTEAKPTFQWSSNVQTAYRVILYDENEFIVWDTGEIEGIAKAVTSGITLEEGKNYSVSVLIRNTENFWSEESISSFYTSYSSPPKPTINVYGSSGKVIVEINNPASEGLQPETVSNEVYKLIENEWIRIAVGIPNNGIFVDLTARSNVEEQYRVKAIGDNKGIQYSEISTITIFFRGVYIHDTSDPEGTVQHFKFDGGGRTSNWSKEYVLMNFKGRKKPIVEFSESESATVSVTLQLLSPNDYFSLETLAKSYNTLCYRDGRGRLLFGFIPSLPATDEIYGHEVNFEFIGIDYKGSV